MADRIDAIYQQLEREGLSDQFHPSYTRMVPAHYVIEIQLIGCPDPDPTYTRFFTPQRDALPADLDEIGRRYISALAGEIAKSAPEAIQLTKRLLNETIGESIGTQLSAGAAASATARTTEAAVEGLTAFLEKREPKWM